VIGRLEGIVIEQAANGTCIIDAGGVGYEVFVPTRLLRQLPAPPGKAILHIHTHVREDALTLYGFTAREDRAAFRTLLNVSGIGPKLALAILNDLNATELAMAVAREDKIRFKAVSGVGNRMAERLVIELRDKLPVIAAGDQTDANGISAQPLGVSGNASVVTGALIQMGFGRVEAERAVAELKGRHGELSTEELLREALSKLA
jgi:holliday junction DNA helicase RuvA